MTISDKRLDEVLHLPIAPEYASAQRTGELGKTLEAGSFPLIRGVIEVLRDDRQQVVDV